MKDAVSSVLLTKDSCVQQSTSMPVASLTKLVLAERLEGLKPINSLDNYQVLYAGGTVTIIWLTACTKYTQVLPAC